MSDLSFSGAPCVITHTWKCARCGREEESRRQRYALGFAVATPYPPTGWRQWRFKVYCPAHLIVIRIDGEEAQAI
jgi:hypothetical protein